MSWKNILHYLAALALVDDQPSGTGRPAYPYPLASTASDREAAVAARRQKNSQKPRREKRRVERARARSHGPNKLRTVLRTR